MRRLLLPFLALLLVIGIVAFVLWPQSRGIHVTVMNTGPKPWSDCLIHITGSAHQIGALAIGASRTVRVYPTSESGLEIEIVDPSGERNRFHASAYLEPGYQGEIHLEIEGQKVKSMKETVKIANY